MGYNFRAQLKKCREAEHNDTTYNDWYDNEIMKAGDKDSW